MKKIKIILGILIISGLVISGVVSAATNNGNGKVRVIAETTSPLMKLWYKALDCEIVHELRDATALKCPLGLVSLLNVREDRIFHIIDIEADVQIDADDVWAQGITGSGVKVAVLDTGIDTDHPELSDDIVGGATFVDGTTTYEDDHGHGTHVSGIITANGVDGMAKGVAPDAEIYMYKVCNAGGSCYESDMMAAMEHVVGTAEETKVKVMNISIGGGNFSGENCDGDPLADKVNWVVNNGITVAVAAGNDQFFVSSPACGSGPISVGAVDKDGLMAHFSNFGPSLDIVAPGVNIYSPIVDDYASWSGTSMSAPHIAGTVALMLEANPNLTEDQIKTALYETAVAINSDSTCYGVVRQRGKVVWIGVVECTSDNYGAGIVNALGAVNYHTPIDECDNDVECDDENECTANTCIDPETASSYCESTAVADDTLCSDGICCSGICSGATCSADADCDDGDTCTTDTCSDPGTCLASCSNIWKPCGDDDGCCGPLCDSTNDPDCTDCAEKNEPCETTADCCEGYNCNPAKKVCK